MRVKAGAAGALSSFAAGSRPIGRGAFRSTPGCGEPMAEIIDAFQCTGCGRIDAPRECIGICQDRAMQIVAAGDYFAALERAQAAERENEQLRIQLRQVAHVRPVEGRWQETFEAFQQRARALLQRIESDDAC
jgi:hypothetical protein